MMLMAIQHPVVHTVPNGIFVHPLYGPYNSLAADGVTLPNVSE